MRTRYKNKSKIFDITITVLSAMLSVGVMLYGVNHFGLHEAWPELVLNLYWLYRVAARHSLSAPIGKFSHPSGMPDVVGTAAAHADLLLCPQGMEELFQAQPVDDFHC